MSQHPYSPAPPPRSRLLPLPLLLFRAIGAGLGTIALAGACALNITGLSEGSP